MVHRPLTGAFIRHGAGRRSRRLVASLLFRRLLAPLPRLQPAVTLRARRKAGVTYKVPYVLAPAGRLSFALRWLRSAVRLRPERTLGQRTKAELLELAAGRGESRRRREAVHQTALLNRGFLRLLR